MKSFKVGTTTAVIVTLILGMAVVIQGSLSNFFTLYYTIAVPISLTAGALAFFISMACEDIKSRSGISL